jgi:hypothetical protein
LYATDDMHEVAPMVQRFVRSARANSGK